MACSSSFKLTENFTPNSSALKDPYAFINLKANVELKNTFEECNFDKVEPLLKNKANANQSIFLTPQLVSSIVHSLKDEVLSKVLRKDSYQILYDSFFSDQSKEILLEAIKNSSKLQSIPDKSIEKIVIEDLSRTFKNELDGSSVVSLIWIACMLQKPDLVRALLETEKPADPFDSFIPGEPAKGALCQRLLEISSSDQTLDILSIFITSGGIPSEYIYNDYLTLRFFEAVEWGQLNVISRFSEMSIGPDLYINSYEYPFNRYHTEFIDIYKAFPYGYISPISLALFNNDEKVVACLIENGADLESLSRYEAFKLALLIDLDFEDEEEDSAADSLCEYTHDLSSTTYLRV